ncbi:unnamed protein product [Orchesella dallaii]|uniref:Uncharacterized protein n=1 Tax=Orchesella dallaii TaxID=48710 RepID=A0ABP1QRF4_9HEXA
MIMQQNGFELKNHGNHFGFKVIVIDMDSGGSGFCRFRICRLGGSGICRFCIGRLGDSGFCSFYIGQLGGSVFYRFCIGRLGGSGFYRFGGGRGFHTVHVVVFD